MYILNVGNWLSSNAMKVATAQAEGQEITHFLSRIIIFFIKLQSF